MAEAAIARCPSCGYLASSNAPRCARCEGALESPLTGSPLAPLPEGGPAAFRAGLECCLEGFRIVRSTAGLRALALAPALVNAALLVALVYGVIAATPRVARWIAPDATGFSAFLADAGAVVATIVLALLLHPLIVSIVAAPFNEALSARVERAIRRRGSDAPALPFSLSRWSGDVVRPILQSLRIELFRLGATILLLPLALVPVVGPPVVFLVTAAFAAFDHVDLPASRVGMTYAQKRSLMKRHRAASLGFGVVAQALLLVPIVNVFLLPAAVAGGTLLYFRMRK